MVVDQLPRLEKRELICLLLFTCNHVVSVWRGFLFPWVLGMGFIIFLWHSLSIQYNYSYYKIELINDKYPFEFVHLKFCKFSLGVHSKTFNSATRCDFSRCLILVTIL